MGCDGSPQDRDLTALPGLNTRLIFAGMRAIWKGSISFGLVNIPIGLYPATRSERVSFRQLRAEDLSPIHYKRVAEADGEEVPWEDIVKGYEYEKGQFVALKDKDFEKVMPEATQSIDIMEFVDLADIDPMFFDTPYYLEPQKGGKKAYALLRDTLEETGKVGIARVVIKTKQHLAAVKPKGNSLVLELMHFPDELLEPEGLDLPRQEQLGKKEAAMAKSLVETMSGKWNPKNFRDEFRERLEKLIAEKVKTGAKELPGTRAKAKRPTNVVDLVAVLQKSLAASKKKPISEASRTHARKKKLKKAA
jgi:DNA end-binding protein Ku